MAVTSCLTATSSKSKPRPGLMQNQAPGKATRGKLTKVVIPNDEGRQSDLWRWAWFRELWSCTQAPENGPLRGHGNRPRPEQFHLVDALTSLDRKSAQRILRALHKIAGKEVRARIEEKLEPES
jgi:hypothetical protein